MAVILNEGSGDTVVTDELLLAWDAVEVYREDADRDVRCHEEEASAAQQRRRQRQGSQRSQRDHLNTPHQEEARAVSGLHAALVGRCNGILFQYTKQRRGGMPGNT